MDNSYQSPSARRARAQGYNVGEDRKVLFQDATNSNNKRKKTGPSSTASEAQSIQQSLQRTQNLLKSELNRVSQVATAIDEDGKMLEDTKATHQSLNVSGAKKALTSLQRAQQREQRVLMASVLFFFTVVFYIMWCRILIKLPFVERIINLVLNQTQQLLGEAGTQAQKLLGEARAQAQELFYIMRVHSEGLLEKVQVLIDGQAQ